MQWVPAAAGWTVGVIATLSLFASLSPLIRWIIRIPREFVNDYLFNFPDTSFAWSFVLVLLAAALAARKRIAWWILLVYMVGAIGWNIYGLLTGNRPVVDLTVMEDLGEALGLVFHIGVSVVLLMSRSQFWAKVRRGALLKAAGTLVASMAVGILLAWGLLELFPGTLQPEYRLAYAANRVIGFATVGKDAFEGGHPHVFLNALFGLFGAAALILAAIVLFQSQRAENALTGEDESAIRGLLELWGKNDSLGYFATRRDKAVVFAPNGRAAVTYRVEVGVCLASGDPVGDPRAWQPAIEAWLALCQSYGWAPGVMGASSAGAEAYRQGGLNALHLGDEAILHPESYRLSGSDMRAVRQAVTRARRAGLTVRMRRHRDLSADEMAAVITHADAFEQGSQLGAGPILRLWRAVLIFLSRWWQLEALYRSNMKYLPEWVPRYACYEDARLMPRVGVASVIAEGYLVLPFSRREEQPHTGHHTAVPQTLLDSGRLHQDGSAPDMSDLVDPDSDATEARRLPDQVRVRMAKLESAQDTNVCVAGRVLRLRDYGGVLFAQLRDWSGEIQLLLDNSLLTAGDGASEATGNSAVAEFTAAIDLGDLIEVSGVMGASRNGTVSVLAHNWRLLGKCLRPLPDKWKGLTDPEARVRTRYLDLAINTESRDLITARSRVLHSIRETLMGKGFLEVETPILQQIHGGANARPFETHINAYDLDLYLRIAPELYLKRLCVGGVERVFELGRAFRNEGVDFSHNPEFTLLEAYQAHADYNVWIDGCREIIQNAAAAANGSQVVMRPGPDGNLTPVDISGVWPVKTVHDAVSEALGEQVTPETDVATLRKLCDAAAIAYRTHWDAGAIVLELYEHLVEDRTEAPTFYTD
ncbi:DUF2156 domain-containing protein, partial [Mycobacterium sp. CBMA361]|nr:DUF2156 domain-containing protein [Mycolicibacterium sp. CBMA 361]